MLRQWADRIDEWSTKLKSIYLYFDNDQAGYAAHNAMTLRKMVLGVSAPKADAA
jgi:uncharacterized protein YecE (DUF72 family)